MDWLLMFFTVFGVLSFMDGLVEVVRFLWRNRR